MESSSQSLKDIAFQDLLRAYHPDMSMNSSLWTVPSILLLNEREAVDVSAFEVPKCKTCATSACRDILQRKCGRRWENEAQDIGSRGG